MVQRTLLTSVGFITQNSQHHGSQAVTDHAHDLADPNVFGRALVLHTYHTLVRWGLSVPIALENCVLNRFEQRRKAVHIAANLRAGERDQL